MAELYDRIGRGYAGRRRPDPRIAAAIRRELGEVASVLNVGAGTGSYEPDDVPVTAVEPSLEMIGQRVKRSRVVRARAEALPFGDGTFDAAMAVLTVHHWRDRARGLAECGRVARRRLVLFTWDPESAGFWLVQEYFPENLVRDRETFPSMAEVRALFGRVAVQPVPIPADCVDGFLGSYWRRPEAYLDPAVRAGMSSFSRISEVESRVEVLRRDLESGAWRQRYGHLLAAEALDIGYRLVTVTL